MALSVVLWREASACEVIRMLSTHPGRVSVNCAVLLAVRTRQTSVDRDSAVVRATSTNSILEYFEGDILLSSILDSYSTLKILTYFHVPNAHVSI